MSVDRETLETAITAVYAASIYFSNTANCKKIEARFRPIVTEYTLQTNGFERTTELPAITIIEAGAENGLDGVVGTEPIGFGGDIDYLIPMAVVAVYVASTYAAARTGIRAMLKEASDVAEAQITNALDWGDGAAITELGSLSESYTIYDDGTSFIAKGVMQFTVRKPG